MYYILNLISFSCIADIARYVPTHYLLLKFDCKVNNLILKNIHNIKTYILLNISIPNSDKFGSRAPITSNTVLSCMFSTM